MTVRALIGEAAGNRRRRARSATSHIVVVVTVERRNSIQFCVKGDVVLDDAFAGAIVGSANNSSAVAATQKELVARRSHVKEIPLSAHEAKFERLTSVAGVAGANTIDCEAKLLLGHVPCDDERRSWLQCFRCKVASDSQLS